jgi:hypothetical protein
MEENPEKQGFFDFHSFVAEKKLENMKNLNRRRRVLTNFVFIFDVIHNI